MNIEPNFREGMGEFQVIRQRMPCAMDQDNGRERMRHERDREREGPYKVDFELDIRENILFKGQDKLLFYDTCCVVTAREYVRMRHKRTG